jgi:hypothetical protein
MDFAEWPVSTSNEKLSQSVIDGYMKTAENEFWDHFQKYPPTHSRQICQILESARLKDRADIVEFIFKRYYATVEFNPKILSSAVAWIIESNLDSNETLTKPTYRKIASLSLEEMVIPWVVKAVNSNDDRLLSCLWNRFPYIYPTKRVIKLALLRSPEPPLSRREAYLNVNKILSAWVHPREIGERLFQRMRSIRTHVGIEERSTISSRANISGIQRLFALFKKTCALLLRRNDKLKKEVLGSPKSVMVLVHGLCPDFFQNPLTTRESMTGIAKGAGHEMVTLQWMKKNGAGRATRRKLRKTRE